MRVLIVSHNLISQTSNMGKTLRAYFRDFSLDEVAQFYIHSEVPVDDSVCVNYYRFTDVDALRSILLPGSRGQHFGPGDVRKDRLSSRTDSGTLTEVYRAGRRRKPWTYLARSLVWKLSRWDNRQLWAWVEDFSPDVIFFASGDYGFMYDVARKIAEHVNKPLVVNCVDDYYLCNRNKDSLSGRLQHRRFMDTVYKTAARSSELFVICGSMQREYEKLFGKPCRVLHTAAESRRAHLSEDPKGIAYLGNMAGERNVQLAHMGRALRRIAAEDLPDHIDVYSAEQSPDRLAGLTPENGICFHGAVSAEQVSRIMEESLAVIHTESFEKSDNIRYSVSTKIADSLMNGPCIIAYGPEGIASIDYLKENRAAYVITDPEKLETGLREILTDGQLRAQIVQNARDLAKKNHDPQTNPARVRAWLEEVCENWKKDGSGEEV